MAPKCWWLFVRQLRRLGRYPDYMFSPWDMSNFKSSRLWNHLKPSLSSKKKKKKKKYIPHPHKWAGFICFLIMGRGCEYKHKAFKLKLMCFNWAFGFPAHYLPHVPTLAFIPCCALWFIRAWGSATLWCFVTSWNVKAKMENFRITLPIPSWL